MRRGARAIVSPRTVPTTRSDQAHTERNPVEAGKSSRLSDSRVRLSTLPSFDRSLAYVRPLVVSTAEEGGAGGLRRALSCAQPGEVIIFAPEVFPSDAPTTITLTRALPRLNKGSVAIGASNAGVILDGSETGTVEYGLHLFSNSAAPNPLDGLVRKHIAVDDWPVALCPWLPPPVR